MATARRFGAPDAKNRGVLLDAAEQLLLEEGYAAVTSRRVADAAGLKPQLVHYYFRGMEDLFLEVFRRRAEEGLAVLTTALQSPQPLWALWRFSTMPEATRLTMEFMGLANHRKALRAEIVYYAERFREEQNKAIATALERYGISTQDVPPVVWTVFATSVSQAMVMERALGMFSGHAETFKYCEQWLRRLEGEPLPANAVESAAITSCEESRARPSAPDWS
jgi:TetR/AcrR family transcriptional regulator